MSSSAVIQSLLGKWKDSSADAENLEAYLKAIGMPDEAVKAACQSEATTEWTVDGDAVTYSFESSFKPGSVRSITFQLGQPFEENTITGRSLQTTYTEEGGKLVKRQIGEPFNCTITTEIVEPGLIVETMVCDSNPPTSCKRKLRKQ